jgi:pseudaminic acid biosynthesis-associated methylase
LFSKILRATHDISSVIELGANIGLNLDAIKALLPSAKLAAVEINEKAVELLAEKKNVDVYNSSILDFSPDSIYDFALIKGVLIHINPNELDSVYDLLSTVSKRYVCIAEYYNPSPIEVEYRGHQGRLFKRDFAGEFLDRHTDFYLVDYGFVYHRDSNFPQDDTTWFLMERR